jgi:DnaJ-domain-containing protein 1
LQLLQKEDFQKKDIFEKIINKLSESSSGPIQKVQAILRKFKLSENSTKAEIKKAYLALIKKEHPDISSNPNAKEKFQKVQKAYGGIML